MSKNLSIFEQYKGELRYHTIEVLVDDQSGEYYLQDDSVLRKAQVLGFQTQPSDLLFGITALGTQPVSMTSRPLALTPAIFSGYLTVKCGSDNITETYPLISSIPTINDPGHFSAFKFFRINPSRSFITVNDPTNNAVAGSSFLLGFYYLRYDYD